MAPNETTTTDELTDDQWRRVQDDLLAHLDDFRSVYGDEDNNNEIVKETDDYVLFRDGSGHELNEIADINDVDSGNLSQRMHKEARRLYHSDEPGDPWSYTDPIVVFKRPQSNDEIDSTLQQLDDPDMFHWQGTHVWGDYSVTREFYLNRPRMQLDVLTKYEHDGEEVNRSEQSWDVSECDGLGEMVAEVERYIVDHSGETVPNFVESNHYADPQLDIEGAIEEAE